MTDVAGVLTTDELDQARTSLAGTVSVAAQLDAATASQIVATARHGFVDGASIGLAVAATVAALGRRSSHGGSCQPRAADRPPQKTAVPAAGPSANSDFSPSAGSSRPSSTRGVHPVKAKRRAGQHGSTSTTISHLALDTCAQEPSASS